MPFSSLVVPSLNLLFYLCIFLTCARLHLFSWALYSENLGTDDFSEYQLWCMAAKQPSAAVRGAEVEGFVIANEH